MQAIPIQAIGLPAKAGNDDGTKIISLTRSDIGMIGITFYRPGNALSGPFRVREVLQAGPADMCGLIRAGDLIWQVDGQDVHGLAVDEMSLLLCGPPHSQLTLVIARTSPPPTSSSSTCGSPRKSSTCSTPRVNIALPTSSSSRRSTPRREDVTAESSESEVMIPSSHASTYRLHVQFQAPAVQAPPDGVIQGGAHPASEGQSGIRSEQLTRDNSGALGIWFARPENDNAMGYEVIGLDEGGAAQKSGTLKPGDRIYKVDGQSVLGLSVDEISQLLHGPPSSPVQLELGTPGTKTGTEGFHYSRLRLMLALKPSTVGADGSRQRRAFGEVVLQEVALACGQPKESFEIMSIDVNANTVFLHIYVAAISAAVSSAMSSAYVAAITAAVSSGSAGTILSNCVLVEVVDEDGQNPGSEPTPIISEKISTRSQDGLADNRNHRIEDFRASALASSVPQSSNIFEKEGGVDASFPTPAFLSHFRAPALPSSVSQSPNLLEIEGAVDVSLVLGLDFSHAGQEGTQERSQFERHISENLAFASGWQRQQRAPVTRMVNLERSKDLGLGLTFSVPAKRKEQMTFAKPLPPSCEQCIASAKIKAVAAGSPAALSGLTEGERIYEIDDKPIHASMNSEEIAAILRGVPGTVVRLRVGPPQDNSATGLPPECFVVKNLMPGSIYVDATVLPLASNKSHSRLYPSSVAADLASQAHNPASRLRTGSLTQHLQSLTVKSLPGQQPAAATNSTASALDLHSPKPDTNSDVPPQKIVSVVRSDTGCVGLSFTRKLGEENGPFYVYNIKENGPAHKTGQITVGDAIHEIDGCKVHNLEMEEMITLVRGWPASRVTIIVHSDPDGTCIVEEVKRASEQTPQVPASKERLRRSGENQDKTLAFEPGFVGLVVSPDPPHAVSAVHDLVDTNGVVQGAPGYHNERVDVGDFIMFINNQDVRRLSVDDWHELLRGELHSAVEIVLQRKKTMAVYTVEVLRHRKHEYSKPDSPRKNCSHEYSEPPLKIEIGDAPVKIEMGNAPIAPGASPPPTVITTRCVPKAPAQSRSFAIAPTKDVLCRCLSLPLPLSLVFATNVDIVMSTFFRLQ
jgi:C-terminal processing protease CtpA/Prc